MNPNYRNLALWAIIAVLLIALFNLFQTPQQRGASREIAYSEFLQDLSGGRVKTVTIAGEPHHRHLYRQRQRLPDLFAGRPDAGAAARGQGRHHQRAPRERRLQLDLRLPDLVAADGADPRRLDILHAADAVRLGPRHGLRQVQGQAAHRGAWPRHLPGRGRRRRGQGRSRGDRRVPARPAEIPAAGRQDPARRAAGRTSRNRQDACWRAPSPAKPTCRSSPSPAPTSSKCSSASARRVFATCSTRPRRTRPASSSSTKSTRSAAIAAPASAAAMTSASRPSTSCWSRWTASRPMKASS